MHYLVRPSKLRGTIAIPPSKSQTLRALLFAALARGKSCIHHYLHSPDTQAMIQACRLLGAQIEIFPDRLEVVGIEGKVGPAEDVIQAGNSGIVFRFCTAVGALGSHPIVVTGDHSIRHVRPIQPLLEALEQLGVRAFSTRGDGHAPVIIQGPLRSGRAVISGEDSQPVSALLIAAAFAEGPIEIEVRNLGERPWVHLTLDWLSRLGIGPSLQEKEKFYFCGKGKYEGFEYRVPGDFSTAAFPLAAALVTQSEITLKNLTMGELQGDKEVLAVLQRMGAEIESDSKSQTVHVRSRPLKGLAVDINDFVDALPILAVVACHAAGSSLFHNAAMAKYKECDRVFCTAHELTKMGGEIVPLEDGLRVSESSLKGATLDSHGDHRMAMALTVAALSAQGESRIRSVACVAKTFPTFLEDLQALGADIQYGE